MKIRNIGDLRKLLNDFPSCCDDIPLNMPDLQEVHIIFHEGTAWVTDTPEVLELDEDECI